MEIETDGDFILVPDDMGVLEVNPTTGATRGLIGSTDAGPWRAAIAPSGAIVADSWRIGNEPGAKWKTSLARLEPDGRLHVDLDLLLADFAFSSDERLMAVADTALYQINTDSGEAALMQESEVLQNTVKMAIDPDGRFLALTRSGEGRPNQLVRLDLEAGTTEILDLNTNLANDMAIVIIPEPATFVLLLLNAVGGSVTVWPSLYRATALRRPPAPK